MQTDSIECTLLQSELCLSSVRQAVVKELPEALMERHNYNMSNITNIRVHAWAPVSYYMGVVYLVLQKEGVIRIAPFANRLAISVPPHIQFLRCLTNYKALRFTSSISTLAKKLVNRMIEKSSRTGGKYIVVHLRFEEDMVAFSRCIYDGGEAEKSNGFSSTNLHILFVFGL
ncbi:hypothetical protein RIF29_18371 [Crotalaria pallida]|uniref:O-fucosyltransferase family protein n=1 Tax=Crotalaria pallida TaxID=3830 RepID=A0AAN9FJR9_CROPI